MSTHPPRKERIIVYVDGFNLYFGMIQAGLNDCKWLNIHKLANSLLKNHQQIIEIKYFTSRVSNNPDKQKRQTTYVEALETTNIEIFYGQYQQDTIFCRRCGHSWSHFNEKMTDVNIATQIIIDAYKNSYDTAMLISGDSDLVPPMKAVHQNFPDKRVFVAFPPKRHNNSVAIAAKGFITIGRKKLKNSQFEEKIIKSDGFTLKKPPEW